LLKTMTVQLERTVRMYRSHDVPTAFGQLGAGCVELIADVNSDGIALADSIVFDDPVVASLCGQGALLGPRKAVAGVFGGSPTATPHGRTSDSSCSTLRGHSWNGFLSWLSGCDSHAIRTCFIYGVHPDANPVPLMVWQPTAPTKHRPSRQGVRKTRRPSWTSFRSGRLFLLFWD